MFYTDTIYSVYGVLYDFQKTVNCPKSSWVTSPNVHLNCIMVKFTVLSSYFAVYFNMY